MAPIGPDVPNHLQYSRHQYSESPEPGPTAIGPQVPSTTPPPAQTHPVPDDDSVDEDGSEDDYTPALPPHLIASRAAAVGSAQTPKRRVLGPTLGPMPGPCNEDSDDEIGPAPLPPGHVAEEHDAVGEFIRKEEQRRKAIEDAAKPKVLKRDEWMLAPPSSSDLLSKIDPTRMNKPRQFSRSTAPAKNTDTSLWTETPEERQQRLADEVMGKRRRKENANDDDTGDSESAEDARKRRRRDAELQRQVEEHTRKFRGASLLDSHAEREAQTAKDPNAAPSGIWDHARDMAVGGRLMDEKDRRKIINDSKGLSDRFGVGRSGGFL